MARSLAPYIHVILADVVSITLYINKPLVRLTTAHYQSAVSMISFAQVSTVQWSDTIPCRNIWFQLGITSHNIPFQQRARQMRRIRERAGVLKQLKRELWQAHKLSQTESGFPGIRWWHLKYWDERLRVTKEEPTSPTIVNIKVESPSTPHLQYPSWSPTTPSSHYRSIDPNDFENWGDLATA